MTVLEAEAARFHSVLDDEVARGAAVPSCPGWNGSDLLWHLAEVHHFWTHVLDTRPADPDAYEEPERPADGSLLAFARTQTDRLLMALRAASPDDRCWSWQDGGGSVAWVARRQAHEAMIHRTDAELCVARPVTDVEVVLAADGVDEVVDEFLGDVPAWGRFGPDGRALVIELTDAGTRRTLEFGRFTGTSPNSGNDYDLDHARPTDVPVEADATVAAPAWRVDRWLWGRAPVSDLQVAGDRTLPDRLRAIISEASQ